MAGHLMGKETHKAPVQENAFSHRRQVKSHGIRLKDAADPKAMVLLLYSKPSTLDFASSWRMCTVVSCMGTHSCTERKAGMRGIFGVRKGGMDQEGGVRASIWRFLPSRSRQ